MAIIGLLLSFLQYEKISAALWVVWPVVYIAVLIAALIVVWRPYSGGKLGAALVEYRATLDKSKWMEGPNKKRRAKAARARKR